MTASLIKTPPVVSLQGIPCEFVASSSNGTEDIYMHLRIQQLVGAVWTDTTMEDRVYMEDGACTFDISDWFLNSFKSEFAFPEHHTNLKIERPGMVQSFRVKLFEEGNEAGAIVPNQIYYMLPGGISLDDYSDLNEMSTNWWEKHQESKRALNWMPANKYCCPQSIEKIYWIQPTSGNDTLQFDWIDTDGNAGTTNTIIPFTAYVPAELSVSPAIAEAITQKTLASYKVKLLTAGFEQQYTLDRNYYEFNDFYLPKNDFGAFEGVWCHGTRTEKLTYERNQYQRADVANMGAFDRMVGSVRGFVNRENEANSGYLDRSTRKWLVELLNSDDVYRINGLSIRPIVLTSESIDYLDQLDDDVVSISFEWKYSRQGKYSSNMAINLSFIYPPYYSQLSVFFYKQTGAKLLDKIGGLEANISGTDITFPEISGNDIFNFSNASYWDQTLIAATGWYNAGSPRTCPLTWLVGTEWAEAATAVTHGSFFHKDYEGKVRDFLPGLGYKAGALNIEQQQVVVDFLEWYATIWENGSMLTQDGTPITQ